MIDRIIMGVRTRYYKWILEKKTGKKLPSVIVKGKVSFENCIIDIGENVVLYNNISFSGNGMIQIGPGSKIGQDTIIYANKNGGVTIGRNTIIAAQTYIIDSNHGINRGKLISQQPLIASKVTIGNDVWIGANATILSGVHISDGAVVGAKALVNKDVPQDAIVVGVPAIVKGYRKDGDVL